MPGTWDAVFPLVLVDNYGITPPKVSLVFSDMSGAVPTSPGSLVPPVRLSPEQQWHDNVSTTTPRNMSFEID